MRKNSIAAGKAHPERLCHNLESATCKLRGTGLQPVEAFFRILLTKWGSGYSSGRFYDESCVCYWACSRSQLSV